jgi:hypothetical protein
MPIAGESFHSYSNSGLGVEYWLIDDDNSHDGKGPKYATIKIGSNGRESVWDADAGFSCQYKELQRMIDDYFELKNREEYEELLELRELEKMATKYYGREKMRYIIDD